MMVTNGAQAAGTNEGRPKLEIKIIFFSVLTQKLFPVEVFKSALTLMILSVNSSITTLYVSDE